jgi:hypothetical protein
MEGSGVISRLVFEKRFANGERVRIWRQRGAHFDFEHLMPTGQGRIISCATLGQAMVLWSLLRQEKSGGPGLLAALDSVPTDRDKRGDI